MPRFDPKPGDKIPILGKTYEVMPHPIMKSAPFGQEGGKAVVYQMRYNSRSFAFKIFRTKHQDSNLIQTCHILSTLNLKGLDACKRECITTANSRDLVQQYPEFEYAMLMPWIQGSTWFDIINDPQSPVEQSTSWKLAQNVVQVLARLEAQGYSHCDISSGNLIVNMNTGEVNLIDVEDMYGPGLPQPKAFPRGSEGYHHPSSRVAQQGQWHAYGDRFASAILLAEILAWHDSRVRQASYSDSFFPDHELQDLDSDRYRLMVSVLRAMKEDIADYFVRAWKSTTLADCPRLSDWAAILNSSVVKEWVPLPPPPPPPPYRPKWNSIIIRLLRPYVWTMQSPNRAGFLLRWAPVSNAVGYIVESSDDRDFVKVSRLYQGIDTALSLSTTASKYFRVCAYDAYGNEGEWTVIEKKR